MKLVFASNNKHKLEEVRQILPVEVQVISLQELGFFQEIEEVGVTLEENSALKARVVWQWLLDNDLLGIVDGVFADDTGLGISALGGAPGVRTARWAGDDACDMNNRQKIKGILITHGHEDHIGALPYVLQDLPGVPVFASKLSVALIENKLKEHKNVKCKPNVVKAGQVIKIGCFQVEFVKVTHSISGAMALAITTPVGVYFHTGDYKLDYTPIDGEPMNLIRLAEIGSLCRTILE